MVVGKSSRIDPMRTRVIAILMDSRVGTMKKSRPMMMMSDSMGLLIIVFFMVFGRVFGSGKVM